MLRKKPSGDEYKAFASAWRAMNHEGKIQLALDYGVSYDTAKHWVMEGEGPVLEVLEETPADELYTQPNVPTELWTIPGEISMAAVLGDAHSPYQDDHIIELIEEFLQDYRPGYVIYNGDMIDFYQVSTFSKDPARLPQLQTDINITVNMLRRQRAILPDALMFYIEGTHENRWVKYLQDKAPALAKLDGTAVPAMLGLRELDITYVPFERGLLVNGTFLILHGDLISKHSSYTAKMQFEAHGGSGMCNHTHRGGSFYKRDRVGTHGWWENFCLCTLQPDWMQNPNWQQGFSVVYFQDDGRFWVEQIPIIEGKFIYGGKLYE